MGESCVTTYTVDGIEEVHQACEWQKPHVRLADNGPFKDLINGASWLNSDYLLSLLGI